MVFYTFCLISFGLGMLSGLFLKLIIHSKQRKMRKNYILTLLLALTIIKASAQPTVAAPTPPTRPASNVISTFSGAYTDLAGTDWYPNWGQATQYAQITVAGDAVKKYSNLNYQGVQVSDFSYSNNDWSKSSSQINYINKSITMISQFFQNSIVLS